MDLASYESAKFELAQILRDLGASAPKGLDATDHALQELFARLAEDRFNLLVVGRFSRGKSSLMNALLGVDRLPTGMLPLTSVITSVMYGSQEKVGIVFEAGGLTYTIPFEQLTEYITEQGNPGNKRRVRLAQIALPVELLRRGFHFVDSPGMGSAIAENTRTTQAFLPEADAVILVSGFEAPLTQEEEQVACWASRSHLPLFIVLNKQDTVSRESRLQVVQYVQRKMEDIRTGPQSRIFTLSARDALKAKLSGSEEELQKSGLPELETELNRFLTEERGRAFLRAMCERVSRLVNLCPLASGIREPLQARLSAFHDRFSGVPLQLETTLSLVEHTRMTECRLCKEVKTALFEFLRQYQYDLAVNAEAGEKLAADGGLCSPHTHLYASLATDRNLCVSLTPLLKHLASTLRDGSSETLLKTQPACRLCELQEQVESAAIDAWLNSGGGADAWGSICLPHLRKLVRNGADGDQVSSCSRYQTDAIERLVEDMQRYALKWDGIRRGLASEEETDAARRATAVLAGHRVVLADLKVSRIGPATDAPDADASATRHHDD